MIIISRLLVFFPPLLLPLSVKDLQTTTKAVMSSSLKVLDPPPVFLPAERC